MKGQEMDFVKPFMIILMVDPYTWSAVGWLLIGAFVVWFAQFLFNRYLRKRFQVIFQAFEKFVKKDSAYPQGNNQNPKNEKTK